MYYKFYEMIKWQTTYGLYNSIQEANTKKQLRIMVKIYNKIFRRSLWKN